MALDYANGYVDSSGTFRDQAHPSRLTTDGNQRFAAHVANAALYATGQAAYMLPKFDHIIWTETYVDVGSSAGDIPAARLERGMAPLSDAYAPGPPARLCTGRDCRIGGAWPVASPVPP